MSQRAILYYEPGIRTILVQSSFFLALNAIGYFLDRTVFCGLVGQILVGVAYGTPGAQILSTNFETVATNVGYLGLILLVFEGGLSTSISALRANIHLSLLVAATGILLPIAFSFSLLSLTDSTILQAFAAGCALCSTSLGTTFSVLKTTGLATSRLGTILASAAMLDDVVGLVMVQVISNLGNHSSSLSSAIVIRPVFVSVAYAVGVPLLCWFLSQPVMLAFASRMEDSSPLLAKISASPNTKFLFCTLVLAALVASSSYAGTSNLFAAYLAGAAITWLDENGCTKVDPTPLEIENVADDAAEHRFPGINEPINTGSSKSKQDQVPPTHDPSCDLIRPQSPKESNCAEQSQSQMDDQEGRKSFTHPEPTSPPKLHRQPPYSGVSIYEDYFLVLVERLLKPMFFASIGFSIPITQMFQGQVLWRGLVYAILMLSGKLLCAAWLIRFTASTKGSSSRSKRSRMRRIATPKPKSLYPASLLGFAMVARGEIGFLIAAVAQAQGIFTGNAEGEDAPQIFMIVTWAILFCTVSGPITVGCLARRVRRLQALERKTSGGKEDPLGIWGVGINK